MSIVTCDYCQAQVDSDVDLEIFVPDDGDGFAIECAKCRGALDAKIGYAMRALYTPPLDRMVEGMERDKALKIAMRQVERLYGPESGLLPTLTGDLMLLGALGSLDPLVKP